MKFSQPEYSCRQTRRGSIPKSGNGFGAFNDLACQGASRRERPRPAKPSASARRPKASSLSPARHHTLSTSVYPKRADRHRPEPGQKPALVDHATTAAGKCPGTPTGFGNGTFRVHPCPLESRLEIGQKLDFTAKEMRHARNINNQPVRSAFRRMRSMAAGPSAQTFKRPTLADHISGPCREHWTDGACIGKCHAAMKPCRACDAVQTMQMFRVRRPEGQRERPLNGAGPQADVARQPGEPDGQQPSCHSSSHQGFRLFPFCSY